MRLVHFAMAGDLAGGVERYLADLLEESTPGLEHQVIVEADRCDWAGRWPWRRLVWSAERAAAGQAPEDPGDLPPGAVPLFHFPPADATLDSVARRGIRAAVFCHDHRWWCASGTRRHARLGRPCAIVAGVAPCALRYHALRCGGRRLGPMLRGLRSAAAGRRALRRSEPGEGVVLVASSYMRDEAVRHGAPAGTTHVVPLATSAASRGVLPVPTEVEPRLLFASRLTSEKGPEVLLAAFDKMATRARLVIAGGGIAEPRTRAAVAVHRRRDSIELLGMLAPEGVRAQLARAAAVVVPSVWPEPFGLAGIEALAAGRPVVASRIGGVEDWARPELGVIAVAPGSPGDLAAALDAVVGDRAWADRARIAGSAWVRARHAIGPHIAALGEALGPLAGGDAA